jgi:hypothetical protein
VVISAPSLQTAHRRIRDRYGDDAVILSTRTVARRHELGLGQERVVEVVVQPPGSAPSGRPAFSAGPYGAGAPAPANSALPADLLREVERIEALVEQVSTEVTRRPADDQWVSRDGAAGPLVAAGTSPAVARRLLARFTAAHGHGPGGADELRRWLGTQLRASNCDWDGFYGCHAFLGDSGVGRSDLVLAAALRLQAMGRRTMVLGVLPADPGYVHRLQETAAAGGFDAAVVTATSHLTAAEPHFASYDAVLVELPRLDDPALALGGALHAWLAPNVSFHRHLVLAADRDPADQADLAAVTRDWNCDWVAFTRLDRTRRPGKLLDVLENVPLAVSLLGRDPLHGGTVDVASSAAVAALATPVPAAAGRVDRGVRS